MKKLKVWARMQVATRTIWPAKLHPTVESTLAEHFAPDPSAGSELALNAVKGQALPALHLMEQEGYRALTAFLPAAAPVPEEEIYRAPRRRRDRPTALDKDRRNDGGCGTGVD